MDETDIRLSVGTLRLLEDLSQRTGMRIPVILDKAVEAYGRKIVADEEEREFAAFKAEAEAWADEIVRRRMLVEIGWVPSHLTKSTPDQANRPPV